MKRKEQKFPFSLKTQEKKDKYLKKLKISFFIPLFSLILAMIVSYILNLEMLGGILFLIGFVSLRIFLLYFWIINLIVMWRLKRRTYFWFSIPFQIISLIFYFREFHLFLKGENSIKELAGKEEQKEITEKEKKYVKKHQEEDNKEFIKFLKTMGMGAIVLLSIYLLIRAFQ